MTDAAPRAVRRRVLPETRLVGKNHRPVFPLVFVKTGLGVSIPTILLPGIRAGHSPPRTLHRIAQAVEQLAHMARMVLHAELLFDHPSDHRRGPHSAIQSVGYRTAVRNVLELFSLPLRQHRRPTRTLALTQAIDPMSLIERQPGAWNFENFRQFASGPVLRSSTLQLASVCATRSAHRTTDLKSDISMLVKRGHLYSALTT